MNLAALPLSASRSQLTASMAETRNGDQPQSKTQSYGSFQTKIYAAGVLHGMRPSVTTDPNKLEAEAKRVMKANAYAYVAGGAGERATMDANRLAFRQWKVIPRMLRSTSRRDLRVNIFGHTYQNPIFCAPVGVQSIFHPDGEKGVAEIAAEIGVPYIASTASSFPIEEIAQANGNGDRWYQLYWPQTKAITESLLSRAKAANYKVLVVTLDTWAMAWRPWDLDNAYVPFFLGVGNATGFSDPAFQAHFKDKSGGKDVADDVMAASQTWIGDVFSGASHTWEELAHIREHWTGPILLKGIQHPADAEKALDCGVDGVIVSNHGGRQLDGAIGSLEMLPEIVHSVKGKKSKLGYEFTVLFDSGIRTGVDVIKALCLGASGVLVGRPWVYGLGINGKRGAKDVLQGLLADLDQSMGLGGMAEIKDCTMDMLRRVEYGGDTTSNN